MEENGKYNEECKEYKEEQNMGVKMPPIEKVHEAYGAIADNRIVLRENEADVSSSDLSKTYLVTWKDKVYTSNDNASYWQGYASYPIIAVLMLQGNLSLNREIAGRFQGIDWKKRNTEHKNKYAEVVDEIMEESDQICIARGDLGNAMPLWKLPGIQKDIARRCREAGKPFCLVTQMLWSMERRPVPTRAEVCDIYNGVLDGASSLMLTGETAAGHWPVQAMGYLVKTANEAIKNLSLPS